MKTKRRAQAHIYEQTKDLTPEQLVAHYQRLGEAARQRQAELRARAQNRRVSATTASRSAMRSSPPSRTETSDGNDPSPLTPARTIKGAKF